MFTRRTYLAGHELSLADVAVYVGLSGSRYVPPKVRTPRRAFFPDAVLYSRRREPVVGPVLAPHRCAAALRVWSGLAGFVACKLFTLRDLGHERGDSVRRSMNNFQPCPSSPCVAAFSVPIWRYCAVREIILSFFLIAKNPALSMPVSSVHRSCRT